MSKFGQRFVSQLSESCNCSHLSILKKQATDNGDDSNGNESTTDSIQNS